MRRASRVSLWAPVTPSVALASHHNQMFDLNTRLASSVRGHAWRAPWSADHGKPDGETPESSGCCFFPEIASSTGLQYELLDPKVPPGSQITQDMTRPKNTSFVGG